MGTMSLFNWLIALVFGWALWKTIKSYREGHPDTMAMASALISFIVGILSNVK